MPRQLSFSGVPKKPDNTPAGRRKYNRLRGLTGYKRLLPPRAPTPVRLVKTVYEMRKHAVAVNPEFCEEFGKKGWPCLTCRGRGEVRSSVQHDTRQVCTACEGKKVSTYNEYRKYLDGARAQWMRDCESHQALKERAHWLIEHNKLNDEDLADILEFFGVDLELERWEP